MRALLAEETAALRTHEGVDVQGVFLRIEAAKGMIDRLPLRLPEYTADEGESEPEPSTGERSVLEALLARTDGLVRFRRHDVDARRPLLAPDEVAYLERDLRLALDRAQLAALRGDQTIYAASLTAARERLDAFVDTTGEAAAALAAELDALLAVDLEKPLPDIGRSFARLRDLRGASSADDAPDG